MRTFDKNNVATPKNGIPYHRAAIRAYKELGIYKD
jgi:TRAP-type uncharacterized transport system substrate-binding protein